MKEIASIILDIIAAWTSDVLLNIFFGQLYEV